MILTCPACAARYRLADDAIPSGGRTVRCAACQHSWLETGPPLGAGDEAAAAPAAPRIMPVMPMPVAPAPAAPSLAAAPIFVPPAEPPPLAVARVRPADLAPAEAPPKRGTWFRNLVAVALSLTLFALNAAVWGSQWGGVELAALPVVGERFKVAAAPPPPVPLALNFTVAINTLPDGRQLMAVDGSVSNSTATAQPVPPIAATLVDAAGTAVYRWQIAAPVATLPPGASATFDSSASNYPASAVRLTLAFAPQR